MKPKHEAFILEYLKNGGNGVEAYRRAGFRCKNDQIAATNAGRLIRRAEVSKRIAEGLEQIHQANISTTCITAASLIEDLQEVKLRCMQGVEILDARGNPTGVWRFDSKGALRAIELQGKHIGMFQDKPQDNPLPVADPSEEKLTTTQLIHMILERRQIHAIQIETTTRVPIRESAETRKALRSGDAEHEGFAGRQEFSNSGPDD